MFKFLFIFEEKFIFSINSYFFINLDLTNIIIFFPEIFLIFVGLLELIGISKSKLSDVFFYTNIITERIFIYFSFIFSYLLFLWFYWDWTIDPGAVVFNNALHYNSALIFTKLVICFFFLVILIGFYNFYNFSFLKFKEYSILFIFLIFASFCTISSYNLLILYLSLELQFFIYIILLSIGNDSKSKVGTILYILINLVASLFFIIGLVGIFFIIGSFSYTALVNYIIAYGNELYINSSFILDYSEFFSLIFKQSNFMYYGTISYLELSFLSIILSFSIKLGVAPFHSWIAPVYSTSNLPAVMLLGTVSKITYTASFSILCCYCFYPILHHFILIFILLAFFRLCIGGGLVYGERIILRFIGYNGIISNGSLFLIFAFAFSHNYYNLALNYICAASIFQLIWFFLPFCIQYPIKKNGQFYFFPIVNVDDLGIVYHYYTRNWISFSYFWIIFSSIGFPPTLGFFTKLWVLISIIERCGLESLELSSRIIIGYLFLNLIPTVAFVYFFGIVFFNPQLSVNIKKLNIINFKEIKSEINFYFFGNNFLLYFLSGWCFFNFLIISYYGIVAWYLNSFFIEKYWFLPFTFFNYINVFNIFWIN